MVPARRRSSRLRAEGAQPHEVARLHLHPVAVEPVDALALEHVEPVLHHMRLGERDDRAGLERDDVHMHVMRQIAGIDEALRGPAPLSIGHAHRATRPRA
jgi:hypothetical protein